MRSRAEKSTTLYYQPDSSQTAPLQKNVGDTFTLDVYANPGVNLVSAIRLEINYDPAKLATASATPGESSFVSDPQTLPDILFGPVYTPGKIAVTISAGADPTHVINEISRVGTVTFQALAGTAGSVTEVTYGTNTLVTSAAGVSDNNPNGDQFAENVLSSTTPAFITIADGSTPPPSVTPPPGATPTPTTPPSVATATPTPVVVVVSGPPGPQGPAGPQGPPGDSAPTPVFTVAPTASDSTALADTPTPTLAENPPTATPTLAPTGPGDTVIGFGLALTALTIIGGILFFAL